MVRFQGKIYIIFYSSMSSPLPHDDDCYNSTNVNNLNSPSSLMITDDDYSNKLCNDDALHGHLATTMMMAKFHVDGSRWSCMGQHGE